jgi:hypothetical protein
MEPTKHLDKAARLEKTMRKLDHAEDCETIIENCMLAGTHLLNAALHDAKVSEADLIHSDLLAIDRVKGLAIAPRFEIVQPELRAAFSALQKIESVRPEFIRGERQCTAALAAETLDQYELLKRSCAALGEPGAKR